MYKLFDLHWRDGYKNRIEGKTIEEAFNQAGYGTGALRALDYYEEVKELPDDEKRYEYADDDGEPSEITNPEFIEQIKAQNPKIGDEVAVRFANRTFKYVFKEITNYSFLFGKQVMTK